MHVIVASKNPTKISAVEETIKEYPALFSGSLESVEATSNVPDQPIGLDEILLGATQRAKNAWKPNSISIGIESGLIKVAQTTTGYMDVTTTALYDGNNTHLGISSAFTIPPNMIPHIQAGENLSIAAKKAGWTNHEYVGADQGIIGILTKGRVTRKDYTKQALQMALIQLENPEYQEPVQQTKQL